MSNDNLQAPHEETPPPNQLEEKPQRKINPYLLGILLGAILAIIFSLSLYYASRKATTVEFPEEVVSYADLRPEEDCQNNPLAEGCENAQDPAVPEPMEPDNQEADSPPVPLDKLAVDDPEDDPDYPPTAMLSVKPEAPPKPEPKPEPKPTPKPAPKAETKPTPKADPKPAPKTEAKPAPKAQEKPAAPERPKNTPPTVVEKVSDLYGCWVNQASTLQKLSGQSYFHSYCFDQSGNATSYSAVKNLFGSTVKDCRASARATMSGKNFTITEGAACPGWQSGVYSCYLRAKGIARCTLQFAGRQNETVDFRYRGEKL
ncbi:MAG: hypothetical protein LBD17_01735 [Endomicrobium sp.]|jgi:outer membrane biosynthesis protein TonB|nr:hypothetical protein [Endomicrobium sp.]